MDFPECNSTIGGWSPINSLFPTENDELNSKFDILSKIILKSESSNDCESICNNLIDNLALCKTICSQGKIYIASWSLISYFQISADGIVDICDPNEIDQRNSLEIAATDLTFTCPGRQFLKSENENDLYYYQFRNIMPG